MVAHASHGVPLTSEVCRPVVRDQPNGIVVNGDFNLHGNGTVTDFWVVTGTLDYDLTRLGTGSFSVIGGPFISSKGGDGAINEPSWSPKLMTQPAIRGNVGYSSTHKRRRLGIRTAPIGLGQPKP